MMKHVFASCSLLALLTVSSLPAQAQSSAPAPKTPAPTAPAPTAPAPTAPAPKTPAPAASQTKVSPDELKKFATAVKQLLAITQSAETQMSQAVQKQGLTETRFNEIYRAKKDPAAKPTNQITPKEEQSFNQVVPQLAKIQKDAQVKMDQAVQSQGIPMERFNQIFAEVKGNPQLRQEVQKMIQTN